jgi:hypothetical protein
MAIAFARRAALALALIAASACGSSSAAGPKPEVTLAGELSAQERFRALHEQWVATAPGKRGPLERELTGFVQAYPSDPKSRLARLYLAWLALRRGNEALAERWLTLAHQSARGSASDLASVIRAALWLRAGRAVEAYDALLALSGQLIDNDDRLLCLDELVSAALAARRYDKAVAHMLDLAALAARRHRERVWRTLEPRLASVPLPALERSLETLGRERPATGAVSTAEYAAARAWMRGHIRGLLSRSALVERDVDLAQRLVAAPREGEQTTQADDELALLATQGSMRARIDGRTLGVVLDLSSPLAQQRSIQVTAGIAAALAREGSPRVELKTQVFKAGGSLSEALERLAGNGAGVLAAGVEAASASEAARFAAKTQIPLLALHELAAPVPSTLSPYVFVLGPDPEVANQILRRQLEAQGVKPLLRVGSAEAPCPANPGEPLAEVYRRALDKPGAGFMFEAGARCAHDVLMQLDASAAGLVLGLGLDALTIAGENPRARELWSVGAGALPSLDAAREGSELKAWLVGKGRAPSFYEALGHDAAQFARAALVALESTTNGDAVVEPAAVQAAHASLRAALERANIDELWTSQAQSFGSDRRLARRFGTLRIGRSLIEKAPPP